MKRAVILGLVLLAAWGGWSHWRARPLTVGAGISAADDPLQEPLHGRDAAPFHHAGFTLTPRASFQATARVLHTENYPFDAGAKLAPLDFALGWGRMSDSTVLRQIDITQSNRFYYWHVRTFPIPRREIETHSANMHLIPADAGVQRALERVRPGEVITLQGVLVDADRGDGWRWRTSLTRDDTGNGACELFYVAAVGSPTGQDTPVEPSPQ